MYLSLSFLCGIIVTIMNIFNGQLSNYYGIYFATLIIHLVGLITFILIMLINHHKITFNHHLNFLFYTGGIIGVLTVVFNIMAIGSIGAALLTALGLFGQMTISIVLEHHGWLGCLQKKLTVSKFISLIIVAFGIGVMTI